MLVVSGSLHLPVTLLSVNSYELQFLCIFMTANTVNFRQCWKETRGRDSKSKHPRVQYDKKKTSQDWTGLTPDWSITAVLMLMLEKLYIYERNLITRLPLFPPILISSGNHGDISITSCVQQLLVCSVEKTSLFLFLPLSGLYLHYLYDFLVLVLYPSAVTYSCHCYCEPNSILRGLEMVCRTEISFKHSEMKERQK